MHFQKFGIITLIGLIATSVANPVSLESGGDLQKRQVESAAAKVDELIVQVKSLTGSISKFSYGTVTVTYVPDRTNDV
jgi:hypothetical protein